MGHMTKLFSLSLAALLTGCGFGRLRRSRKILRGCFLLSVQGHQNHRPFLPRGPNDILARLIAEELDREVEIEHRCREQAGQRQDVIQVLKLPRSQPPTATPC